MAVCSSSFKLWLLTAVSLSTLGVGIAASVSARAEDWPQWRGPDRSDVSKEKGLLKAWPEGGPKKVWTSDKGGLGYSGFAVVGSTLYTMGAVDGKENLIAISVADGSQKWSTEMGDLLTNNWGDGPRGTPTVDGQFVYALSGQGNLICANAADGSPVWKKKMSDFGGGVPGWGYCESVLVDGDQVVCTPGGSKGAVIALNKKTGETVWQSSDFTEGAQYASVIIGVVGGQRQYIQLTQKKVVGLDPKTGAVLWVSDWPGQVAVIPTPIYSNGHVYVTSGYGVGCKLIKIGGNNKVEDVYQNKEMKNQHGGVVLIGDHLYGHSDGTGWVCQDFMTGKALWTERRKFGKGAISAADGMLYVISEDQGEVALVEASPDGWNEKGRFKLEPQTSLRKPAGRIWTHPVIANGRLYLRDQELITCFDIKAK